MQSFDGEGWKADPTEVFAVPEVITADEVRKAQVHSHQSRERLRALRSRESGIAERKEAVVRKLRRYERINQIRQICDDSLTRIGVLVVAPLTASGVLVILSRVAGLPFILLAITLCIVFGMTVLLGMKLFRPDDDALASKIESWSMQARALQTKKDAAQAEVARESDYFDRSYAEFLEVRRKFDRRINRFRSANWKILRGVQFEQFLASNLSSGDMVLRPPRLLVTKVLI